MKELEGYIPVRIGAKKLKSLITLGRSKPILDGADQEEDEDHYVWQEGQWCPPGLRKSQKRRV
jgi:hypothetical protein